MGGTYRLKEHFSSFIGTLYFWEWLLVTVVIISFTWLCRRALHEQLRTGASPGIGALVVVAILLASLNFRATPTGDEPHYLIMTQSFLGDGDFDLRNNYERQDYLDYYPDTIPDPHTVVVDGRWYPVHGIGLPILVAPFFAAGGRPAVIGCLILCTIAGLGVLGFLMRQAGFQPRTASVTTLVAGFTLPLVSLSGQIFPEVPAFLLVALALRAVLMPVLAGWGLLGFLLGLALLPWLHPKYVALAGALLLSAALIHRQRRAIPTLTTATGLLLVSVIGLAVLSYQWYRVPLPGAPIVMPQPSLQGDWITPLVGHFFVAPWIGLFGALFDQQSGLFLASPVYVLAIPGIWLLWRRQRTLAIACGLVFAGVYLPAGSFGVWYGGFSSPARLLTPVVPVLALGIASVLDSGGPQRWKLFTALAIPSFLHAYLMTTLPSFTRYGDTLTQHNFFVGVLERMIGLDLTLLFPSFRNPEPITWLTTGIYMVVITVLSMLLTRQDVIQLPIKLELSHD